MLITPSYVDNLYDTKMTWGFGNVGDNNYLCIVGNRIEDQGLGTGCSLKLNQRQLTLYFFYKGVVISSPT